MIIFVYFNYAYILNINNTNIFSFNYSIKEINDVLNNKNKLINSKEKNIINQISNSNKNILEPIKNLISNKSPNNLINKSNTNININSGKVIELKKSPKKYKKENNKETNEETKNEVKKKKIKINLIFDDEGNKLNIPFYPETTIKEALQEFMRRFKKNYKIESFDFQAAGSMLNINSEEKIGKKFMNNSYISVLEVQGLIPG